MCYRTRYQKIKKQDSQMVINIWVIYDHPKDFPNGYAVRRYEVRDGSYGPTQDVQEFQTLEDARTPLRDRGLFCLLRADADDPCIVETWF